MGRCLTVCSDQGSFGRREICIAAYGNRVPGAGGPRLPRLTARARRTTPKRLQVPREGMKRELKVKDLGLPPQL